MTAVVTPTTMTAAYNSLSTAQKTEFKTALGISNMGDPEGGVVLFNPSLTGPTGYDLLTVGSITMPRAGYVDIGANIAMIPIGTPNGTIGAWGCHLLILYKNGLQIAAQATAMAHPTSQAFLNVTSLYFPVNAGDVITCKAGYAHQGTMTNRFQLATSSSSDARALSMSYHYVK